MIELRSDSHISPTPPLIVTGAKYVEFGLILDFDTFDS